MTKQIFSKNRITTLMTLLGLFSISVSSTATLAQDGNSKAVANTYKGKASVTQGEGARIGNYSLTTSCSTGARFVEGATGKVKAEDGTEWIVPMQVHEGVGATDMYNNCNGSGDNPSFAKELKTIVIDEDGEEITATIFGDNYYELYINGKYVARDTINFIPFNSTAVKFKARYPITVAFHMADWETHFGVGMEYDSYNVGDAGLIALFKQSSAGKGTVTNADWKVLPVYLAPFDDPGCVTEDQNGNVDASACSIRPACADSDPQQCRALHYPIPEDWKQPGFDDSHWKNATLYDAKLVTGAPGYMNYADRFGNASFIWSPSLKLDNEVLARYVIQKPE